MANSPYHTAGRLPLALIAGPTASGKSALAIDLAKISSRGVVINADASQVYRDLQILSARPSALEMDNVPHRLFGSIDGSEAYNAARWAEDAKRLLARAWEDEETPVLVGGTGLYLRTLLYGIAPVPDIHPNIRADVRDMDLDLAYAQLGQMDPASATRLHPSDRTRIMRALEVVKSTGRTLPEWQEKREGGIADLVNLFPIILLPPRDWLRERCDQRLQIMFDTGGIDEVGALMDRNLSADLPVMRAIGVPQVIAYIQGRLTRAQALDEAQAATRQYAKRQYTWFRHQPPEDWIRHDTPLSNEDKVNFAIKLQEFHLTR